METYSQWQVNLHTHSNYCDHANGGIFDYVNAAKELDDFKVLGFTEHAPIPGDFLSCNMMMKDLDSYTNDVNKARAENKDLKIFLAAECDYEPILENFYRDELLGKRGFDYLTCSTHLYFDWGARKECFVSKSKDFSRYLSDYVARYCNALETGMFLFGCHPDLFRASYLPWDENAKSAAKDIIQCAIDMNTPLEINGAGLRKPKKNTPEGPRFGYSTDEFFMLAKDMGMKICCGSDAHDPSLIRGSEANETFAMAERLGIKFVDWQIDDNGKISAI